MTKRVKLKVIDGKVYKPIGYTYDGKPSGWIRCDVNLAKKLDMTQ